MLQETIRLARDAGQSPAETFKDYARTLERFLEKMIGDLNMLRAHSLERATMQETQTRAAQQQQPAVSVPLPPDLFDEGPVPKDEFRIT